MQARIFPQGISAIAAGYLTDITDIIVTHAAEAGALIDVEVRVKNVSTETLAITVTGLVEEIQTGAQSPLYYSPDYIWVDPGDTGSFTTSFIMPSEDVRLWVATWYWAETEFVQDLVVYTDISLIEVPAFRTQIVDIIAPASASAGDVVNIEVKVVNFTSFLSFYVGVNCIYDDTVLNFSPEYVWMVPAYPPVTESFTASFIMPDKDFHGLVASWYWDETEWIRDDFGYIDIALTEVPPEYMGTITKMELKYDNIVGIIPVTAKVSQGSSGIVTVWGRNDTTSNQKLGVSWKVYDPDGDEVVAGGHSDWETFWTGPDGEQDFIGGRFDLTKAGIYEIHLGLFMNKADPVMVDEYRGTLCTVEAIEYIGSISKKEFKYDSVIGNIPVAAEVSQGMDGIVTAWGRNDMDNMQQLGMRWEVRDPNGYAVEQYPGGGAINWEYGYTGPGDTQDFIGGRFDLNKLGGYTIFIELFMNPPDPVVVADYDGLLCTVEAIEYAGTITEVWINKAPEGTELPPDTTVVADGNTFEVGTRARNDSSVTFTGTVQVVVYDPDHVKRADKSDSTGIDPGENLYFGEGLGRTFNICHVDKAGDWIIVVVFRGDETTLAHKEYIMTAVPALPEPEFQSFAITGYDGVPVNEQLMVIPGQTVTVHMTVDYRGPAIDGSIYTAIGWRGIYFLPTFSSKIPVHFDASYDFHPDTPYEFDCDVDIKTLDPLEELAYGTILDIYAKIVEVPGPDIYTPFYIGVIAWGKPPEEYELIQHTIHHFAYIYDGDDETTIVTLKTDPFKPADWVPEKFISELEREARESGVRVLETKVYVDTSPLFWTDYKIEVKGTPSGEVTEAEAGVAVGIVIPLWVKILLTCLSLAVGIIIVSWAVKEHFLGIFQHKVGLEDMKPTWGKEALILDIKDTEWLLKKEGRLEQPVTPTETLEGMSEEELREHLDKLGKKVVPPPPDWLKYAIIGGLGVLGVVAILALAPRKKE